MVIVILLRFQKIRFFIRYVGFNFDLTGESAEILQLKESKQRSDN